MPEPLTIQKRIMLEWIAREGGATDPLYEADFKRAPYLSLPPFIDPADLHDAEIEEAVDAGTVVPTEDYEKMGRTYEAALGMVEEAVDKLKAIVADPNVDDADSLERAVYGVIAFFAVRIEWLDSWSDPRCDSDRSDLPAFVGEDFSAYMEGD